MLIKEHNKPEEKLINPQTATLMRGYSVYRRLLLLKPHAPDASARRRLDDTDVVEPKMPSSCSRQPRHLNDALITELAEIAASPRRNR